MNEVGSKLTGRTARVVLMGVIGVSVAGYFVGIDDGTPRPTDDRLSFESLRDDSMQAAPESPASRDDVAAIPASTYAEMRRRETGPTSQWHPALEKLNPKQEFQNCTSCHNPHTSAVGPNETAKLKSLTVRSSRRAFNGAPPVIPHAVERTNDAACYACHGEGAFVGQQVANRMSHGLLANCVQCHATPPPEPFKHLQVEPTTTFVGLPAPTAGDRAYTGAPPVIPHSTWMRERCLSCHGGVLGWPGLEVTHRWRTNCQQCHALSANLEQTIASTKSK